MPTDKYLSAAQVIQELPPELLHVKQTEEVKQHSLLVSKV